MPIAAMALALAGAAWAQTSGAAKLVAEQKQLYGQYLADADGRALYLFEKDTKGTSNCYDACAEVWPPMITSGPPQTGPAVDQSLVGTIERKDGRTQVTYDGIPLYYYVKDQGPGSVTGQDVHDRFGGWYLVSPQGKKIEAEKS
ncbi:COG4315 family predicted lipoprotein [Microvirga roseola]|uniref:COG4315 family predicted lipoprotein n=1 Tax=Microvirga roseola TaxID=2883126 RepID=UPI001E4953A2|nr:hypothetical protein [Microvirga roseola]